MTHLQQDLRGAGIEGSYRDRHAGPRVGPDRHPADRDQIAPRAEQVQQVRGRL